MKRLLAFLALLTLGIVLLRFAIGDELAVSANSQPGSSASRPQAGNQQAGDSEPTERSPRMDLQSGGVNTTASYNGFLDLPILREVPEGAGRMRREEVCRLLAKDSKPIAQGLQQLDDVTVKLFDKGVHSANLTARQAFVELRRDTNGQPSLREGKDIDLRDAVLVTLSNSRMPGLRLELGDVKVAIGDIEIVLTTAPDQPVLLLLDGERKGTLRGKGLQAHLPRDQGSSLRRADIEILSEPVLEAEGLLVRATGRLHYVEDTVSGAAQVTLNDDVNLDLTKSGLLPGLQPGRRRDKTEQGGAVATGDQFTGWLTRVRSSGPGGREQQTMVWQRMLLTGAPATIEALGARLETPRINVQPGLSGQPSLITVLGGESSLLVADAGRAAQPQPIRVTTQRRTHLIRPGESIGSLHRAYGFPSWSLRALDELQVVAVEGPTRLDDDARTIEAQNGVHVFRRDGGDTGIVRGLGEVRYLQRKAKANEEDLLVTGNDGFVLTRTPTLETLRLGPGAEGSWHLHRYALTYGDARIDGLGRCTITRAGERTAAGTGQRTHLQLVAPGGDIQARSPAQGIDLADVIRLDADLVRSELREFVVDGLPATATIPRDGETIVARAPRLLQTAPRSLRLLPMPADAVGADWSLLPADKHTPVLRRENGDGGYVELRGPQLDVHHAGGHDVILDAIAVDDELPHVYARLLQPDGSEPTTIACEARRLRLLPFLLTPAVRQAHLGGNRGVCCDVILQGVGRPWLLVDDVVDFQLDDARQGHCDGRAHRLFVSQGGAAALFVGDPETGRPAFVRRVQDRREVLTEGARVRVFRDEGLRLQALPTFADHSLSLLPTVTLHEADGNGLLSHMRATCRGTIDVWPEAVVFGGPVVAQGILANGDDDPDGLLIDAGELHMSLLPETHDITKVVGKNVRLDWSRLKAQGEQVEIDLKRNVCIVRDPNEARIEFSDGSFYCSPHLEVNLQTFAMMRSFSGHGGKRAPGPAGRQ